MQVLSLSELPLSEGEPGSQFNVQGWVKERDDLLATVESLKGLITRMQTHRETQVKETPPPPKSLHKTLLTVCQSSTSQIEKSSAVCVLVSLSVCL